MKKNFWSWLGVLAWTACAVAATGCKQNFDPFEGVSFEPSEDRRSARLSLHFKKEIQSNLAGSSTMGGYGFLFVGPYTTSEPFEVGFFLDLSVFDDPNYAKIKPTKTLPNKLPISVSYPLAQVDHPSVSPLFDIYGYVDTTDKAWLGVAVMFNPPDDPFFPAGAFATQGFLPNAVGRYKVFAGAFGPVRDSHGKVLRAGGVAVFANIKQLMLPE
jgi:hypothetical protein